MQGLPLNNDLSKEYNPENLWDVLKCASVCSLPYSLIAQVISIREQRMQEKLISELVRRVDGLEKQIGTLCKRNVDEDEAKELIHFSLLKASRCHKEEQVIKISVVIVEALKKNVIDYADAEMLIDIVADLNINESMTFQQIINLFKKQSMTAQKQKIDIWSFTEAELREQKCCGNLLDGMLERLVGKGVLVKETAHVKMTWGGDVAESTARYKLSHYGRLLVDLVYD